MWIIKLALFFIGQTLFILSVYYTWLITKRLVDTRPTKTSFCSSCCVNLFWLTLIFIFIFSNVSFLYFNLFFVVNAPVLALVSFTCLGFFFQFIFYHLVANTFCQAVLYLIYLAKKTEHAKQISLYISNITYIVSFALALALSIYGLIAANRPPVLETVRLELKNFPRAMNGFKILLISDIHIGIVVTKNHVEKVVESTKHIDYDLLAVVGDLTDLPISHSKEVVEPLKFMKPKYGKFFVTGNHDYYTGDVLNWMSYLEHQLNFTVLNNMNVKITKNGAEEFFYLAGIDDVEASRFNVEGHGMDVRRALDGCLKNHSIIMLAHQPKAAKWALDDFDEIDLVLSGHTHGGQLFPMSIMIYLGNPFFSGLYRYKGAQVYVTQGAVYWGVPMRMFSQSEINLVNLYRAE
ncbi:hypothetical protein HELRODRAFT_76151 [Helobdella robusta]|uniref:Calcineurin-like phosphoesterase domain-containing protein n=1 Tax=Helobdella robusta TaxID=6412 RepID=T1G2F7_HELRO|nr:hypothetical protein HELRODRAFT_76151 [Helobdella robusta]ESO07603.1 hypothetical protein HELRODRAFT_76151 [Helobdella robusta]